MSTKNRAAHILVVAFAFAMGASPASQASPEHGDHDARVAGAKVEADSYTAELKLVDHLKAGKETSFEITLQTKGDYHINKLYPYKFKAQDPAPEGVTYPKPVLARGDGQFEEKRGSLKGSVVVAKAGHAHVEGTFYMSVCSDANCVMEKVALSQDVEVR